MIAVLGLLTLLGCGGSRLVERPLDGVGVISVPARAKPVNAGEAYDEDPARLYFRFTHEYGLASWGSGMAYRQILQVSLLAPNATAADYKRWPPRFSPLYSKLARERTLQLGAATLEISAGRYGQNALDEPAHIYLYWDPTRRLQIAWHVVDDDISPEEALEMVARMAASFRMNTDPRAKFTEMGGREAAEKMRAAGAVALARDTLAKAGFGAAAPGKPVFARGVYVEWMQDPEPRFQLVKPLGLLRMTGGQAPVPRLLDADGNRRELRGSVGWRTQVDGAWVSDNRDNAYLPLPGIEGELAKLQPDDATALYYFATTVRAEQADEETIAAMGRFFDELPEIERAWQQGSLVSGERLPLPQAKVSRMKEENERFCFGIDLETGTSHLDSQRRRLCAAARRALPDVRAGRFDVVDAHLRAIDPDIQAAVMLGALYTQALREAVEGGERESRPEYVTALHARALRWRQSAYPEPHTAFEADDYAAGRAADREQLAAILAS